MTLTDFTGEVCKSLRCAAKRLNRDATGIRLLTAGGGWDR
jgi:hypothetical protein